MYGKNVTVLIGDQKVTIFVFGSPDLGEHAWKIRAYQKLLRESEVALGISKA